MTEAAKASASAHDASVVVGLSTPELEALLEARRAQDIIEEPARRIAGLEHKVAKFEALLAEARRNLADEIDAQKGAV